MSAVTKHGKDKKRKTLVIEKTMVRRLNVI